MEDTVIEDLRSALKNIWKKEQHITQNNTPVSTIIWSLILSMLVVDGISG